MYEESLLTSNAFKMSLAMICGVSAGMCSRPSVTAAELTAGPSTHLQSETFSQKFSICAAVAAAAGALRPGGGVRDGG